MKESSLPVTLLLVTVFAIFVVHPASYDHALQAAPIARINKPKQPRQNPNRPRLNVRDYRARESGVMNDTGAMDDTRAIQAAIDAAPDTGAVIYFPAGTYISNNFHVINKNGLTFEGDGFTSIIKRPSLPGNTRIATIENSTDLIFRNIAFDENGITHFGGIDFYGVRRVRIENTRHFDSRPWSLAPDGGDHYSWLLAMYEVPGAGVIANEDITIVNNLIEDLTFEVNYVRRGLIEGNTIRRPYFGFGTFSNGFNAENRGPAAQTEDLVVRNNTIVDPLGAAIAIHLDPGSDISSSFRRILIVKNQIRMSRQVRHGISVGATTMSLGPGRVFEDIEVRDNVIEVSPSAAKDVEVGFFSFSSFDFFFKRVVLVNNQLTGNGYGHGMGMRRAQECIVSGNVLRGLNGTGLEMHDSILNNQIEGNRVETTGLGYWFGASLGGNRFVGNRYFGQPATVLQTELVHSSDVIQQPTQMFGR